MLRPPRPLLLSGLGLIVTALALALTQARLGSPLFFLIVPFFGVCQIAAAIWFSRGNRDRRWVRFAVACAIACRVPLMVGPVNYDSDMVRYVWDGRVQRFGYNPYDVVPSDPSLAHTHTADTVRMPSRHDRTPYPPAAPSQPSAPQFPQGRIGPGTPQQQPTQPSSPQSQPPVWPR